MNKRKLMLTIGSALLVAVMAVGGTLAYFWSEHSVENRFTSSGGVDIITEEPGWEEENGKDLTPSDVVHKDPTAFNKGQEAYVRMIVELIDKNPGENFGKPITDPARINQIMSMTVYDPSPFPADPAGVDSATLEGMARINGASFVLDDTRTSGNKFVYNHIGTMVKNQKSTLFTRVYVPTDWDNDDIKQLGDFDMVIYSQAIQIEGFATAAEAFTALDAEMAKNQTP